MGTERRNPARTRQARSALLVGLVCFVLGQLALLVAMQRWCPELRDLEFGWKIVRLRQRLKEEPAKPVVLMLGSSRTAHGFQATRFDHAMAKHGTDVVSFNLGVSNAGPVRENLALRLALQNAKRPALLILELFPTMFNESGPGRYTEGLEALILSARDVACLPDYYAQADQIYRDWLQFQWVPGYSYRFQVLGRLSKRWLPTDRFDLPDYLRRMDSSGWSRPRPHISAPPPAQRAQVIQRWYDRYAKAFLDYRIGSKPRRALTDMLALCRRENIPVLLVLMPEASEFRSWYTPDVEASLQEMLADVKRDFHVDHVDARAWIADAGMWDIHHLLIPGAGQFTDRLADEVARHFAPLK